MASSTRNCYSRNGTQIVDVAYQPCSSDSSRDSVCCGTNHQGAGHANVANDICDPNGLCQNFEAFDGTNAGVKVWWRQGCTDPTWQSEDCLRDVCNFAKWQVDNAPVQKCSDGRWCCGEKSCCSITSSLFQLAATMTPTPTQTPLSMNTLSVSETPSSGTTLWTGSSFSTTASPTSPPGSPAVIPHSSGLNTGTKAGIGSGIAVGVILLAIIAVLFFKLKNTRTADEKVIHMTQSGDLEKEGPVFYTREVAPVEMLAERVPLEVMSQRDVVELPGSQGVHRNGGFSR